MAWEVVKAICSVYKRNWVFTIFFKARVIEMKRAASEIHSAHDPADHGNKGKVFSASSVTGFGQLSPDHDYRGLYQSPAGRFKEINNNVITYPVPALGQMLR